MCGNHHINGWVSGKIFAGKPEIKPLYFMGKPMVYIMGFLGNHLPGKPWLSPQVSGKSYGFPGKMLNKTWKWYD
jgi:hypothetical protein